MNMTPEKYAFLRSLRVGDVVRLGKSLRVIRAIQWNHKTNGRGHKKNYPYMKATFSFAIRHCSWTGRCYTCYSSCDTVVKNMTLVARNYKSKQPALDSAIAEEITRKGRPLLTCCDVNGVP